MLFIVPDTIALVDYLVLDGDGGPHLRANRCGDCGALFFDRRNACAACGGSSFEPTLLGTSGIIRTFTIVYRAAPSVSAPFVSSVIELDGGGVIKANVVGVAPEPELVELGARVHLVTYPVGTDDEGTVAVGFGFSLETKQVQVND
jgi:uncharacterized OB-fold protein